MYVYIEPLVPSFNTSFLLLHTRATTKDQHADQTFMSWHQDSSLDMSFNTSETNDSTEPSVFQFPELTLPQRNHSITTFTELVAYFDRRPSELHAAFKTTYNITDSLEPSNSLSEFLDKWAKCKNPAYHYLTKEFPEEFFPKLFTILNIEANLMGLVLLASLYPCFREN